VEQGPVSHFQAAIFAIGRYLIALALALIAVIVVVSLARGMSWILVLDQLKLIAYLRLDMRRAHGSEAGAHPAAMGPA